MNSKRQRVQDLKVIFYSEMLNKTGYSIFLLLLLKKIKLSVVAHVYNPATQEVEIGRTVIQG
jgi:hypothetical protein